MPGRIGLSDARRLAAEAMLAVARGADPAAERRAARSRGTFAELATSYVEQHAKKHNRSWRQADALVRRHLIPRWGQAPGKKSIGAVIPAPINRLHVGARDL